MAIEHILIKKCADLNPELCIYSAYMGIPLASTLQKALISGKPVWNSPPFLIGHIFKTVSEGRRNLCSTSIRKTPQFNMRFLTVDIENRTVSDGIRIKNQKPPPFRFMLNAWTFDDFTKIDASSI